MDLYQRTVQEIKYLEEELQRVKHKYDNAKAKTSFRREMLDREQKLERELRRTGRFHTGLNLNLQHGNEHTHELVADLHSYNEDFKVVVDKILRKKDPYQDEVLHKIRLAELKEELLAIPGAREILALNEELEKLDIQIGLEEEQHDEIVDEDQLTKAYYESKFDALKSEILELMAQIDQTEQTAEMNANEAATQIKMELSSSYEFKPPPFHFAPSTAASNVCDSSCDVKPRKLQRKSIQNATGFTEPHTSGQSDQLSERRDIFSSRPSNYPQSSGIAHHGNGEGSNGAYRSFADIN